MNLRTQFNTLSKPIAKHDRTAFEELRARVIDGRRGPRQARQAKIAAKLNVYHDKRDAEEKSNPNYDKVLKTSHQWYIEQPFQDIMSPDGWRDMKGSEQQAFWFKKLITYHEFSRRYGVCTINTAYSYENGPQFPFGEKFVDIPASAHVGRVDCLPESPEVVKATIREKLLAHQVLHPGAHILLLCRNDSKDTPCDKDGEILCWACAEMMRRRPNSCI